VGRTVLAYPGCLELLAQIKPRGTLGSGPFHPGMEVYKFLKKE